MERRTPDQWLDHYVNNVPENSFAWSYESSDPRPEVTFSVEAMDDLFMHFKMFVGSRLMRRLNEGKLAKRMKVTVEVEVEDPIVSAN